MEESRTLYFQKRQSANSLFSFSIRMNFRVHMYLYVGDVTNYPKYNIEFNNRKS